MTGHAAMIMVALNGARRAKADFPPLPITPDEMAREAQACLAEGASALHVHVRKPDGSHALDAGLYRQACTAIRDVVGDDLILQITTEAVGIYQPDEQMQVVRDTRPEAVSIAIRELVPDAAHEPEAAAFLAWLKGQAIAPQFILYSTDDVKRFATLCQSGVIPFKLPFILFALGYHGDRHAAPEDLVPFVETLAQSGVDASWAICAFGRKESQCAAAAYVKGGHVRVGFENNIETPDGECLASNAQSVAFARKLIEAEGGRVMTGAEARAFLQFSHA